MDNFNTEFFAELSFGLEQVEIALAEGRVAEAIQALGEFRAAIRETFPKVVQS